MTACHLGSTRKATPRAAEEKEKKGQTVRLFLMRQHRSIKPFARVPPNNDPTESRAFVLRTKMQGLHIDDKARPTTTTTALWY